MATPTMTRQGERQAYEREREQRASESVIRAMFGLLPAIGELFPERRREAWLVAMRANLQFIYPDRTIPADALLFQEATVRILRIS